VITASIVETAAISAPSAKVCLETKYIGPVACETFKEYVSPTAISEAIMLGWKHDLEDDETAEDVGRDRSQALGLLAHRIMEDVGDGCRLQDVLHSGNLSMLQHQIGIEQDDVEEVWNYLSLLKGHPLVKEMESAMESRNEYKITKPFGKYILHGRSDKVIKTPDGWKILDFKFSGSERHSEAYEFQIRFYLYLAREIFSPLLGAELFYLKDGVSKRIELVDEEIPDFQDELIERIGKYQYAIRSGDLPTLK
jgi:hypothetical protein